MPRPLSGPRCPRNRWANSCKRSCCRFHGGKSTGPKTQAGRARVAEAHSAGVGAPIGRGFERSEMTQSGIWKLSSWWPQHTSLRRNAITRTPSLGFGKLCLLGGELLRRENALPLQFGQPLDLDRPLLAPALQTYSSLPAEKTRCPN